MLAGIGRTADVPPGCGIAYPNFRLLYQVYLFCEEFLNEESFQPASSISCNGSVVRGIAGGGIGGEVLADPLGPRPEDHEIAVAVTEELRAKHLTQHPLDKEIARCLKQFLRELDPLKLYFYQSDIDEFRKSQDSLAQLAAHGDIGFAYKAFNIFLARRTMRENGRPIARHAARLHRGRRNGGQQGRARVREEPGGGVGPWRKRIKFDLLLLKADKAEKKDDKADKAEKKDDLADGRRPRGNPGRTATTALRSSGIRPRPTSCWELYLNAPTTSFDPHSDYMSPSTLGEGLRHHAWRREARGGSGPRWRASTATRW